MTKPSLDLPQVTLCAASGIALDQTGTALASCLKHVNFGYAKFFGPIRPKCIPCDVKFIEIKDINSRFEYSNFILTKLVDHIETEHVLIVQWDGFITNPAGWQDRFLDFDYIGAPWPQYHSYTVGNGGFSLRSNRLLRACRAAGIRNVELEDVAICRDHRQQLEDDYGIRFADEAAAKLFSYERHAPTGEEFGFHGVFNMPRVLGAKAFVTFYDHLPANSVDMHGQRDLLSYATGRGHFRLAFAIISRELKRTGSKMAVFSIILKTISSLMRKWVNNI